MPPIKPEFSFVRAFSGEAFVLRRSAKGTPASDSAACIVRDGKVRAPIIGQVADIFRAGDFQAIGCGRTIEFGKDSDSEKDFTPYDGVDFNYRLNGVDSKLLVAWGSSPEKGERVRLYDGQAWSELESPGHINAGRASDADHVYFVGDNGLLAQLQGKALVRRDGPPINPKIALIDVALDGEDLFVLSKEGAVFRHRAKWEQVVEHPRATSIEVFKGRVWLGAEDGLYALDKAGALEAVDKGIQVMALKAGTDLTVTCPGQVFTTQDGKVLRSWSAKDVGSIFKRTAPPWSKGAGPY